MAVGTAAGLGAAQGTGRAVVRREVLGGALVARVVVPGAAGGGRVSGRSDPAELGVWNFMLDVVVVSFGKGRHLRGSGTWALFNGGVRRS